MIRRVGYRRLLPIVLTSIHVALVLISTVGSDSSKRGWNPVVPTSRYRVVSFQQGAGEVGWDLSEPVRLSVPMKVAISLNLPAVLAAAPIAALLRRGDDAFLLCLSTFLVPPLWYGIGRWIDCRLEYIERAMSPDSTLRRAGRTLTAIGGGLFLVVSVLSVTPTNHHRTSNTYWVGAAMICWSSFFLALAASSRRNPGVA
jgi:hypothetical protein